MWIQVISNTNYCKLLQQLYMLLLLIHYLYTHSLYYFLLLTSYLLILLYVGTNTVQYL